MITTGLLLLEAFYRKVKEKKTAGKDERTEGRKGGRFEDGSPVILGRDGEGSI